MAASGPAYPESTEFRSKSGLDPLGMQDGSINLYQRLVPGIGNVTLRMRYYGPCAWLAAVNAQEGLRTTLLMGRRQLIRRAGALYALSATHGEDSAGVARFFWARRTLAESGSRISFAEHADPGAAGVPYLNQAFGAYGLAYGSQLFEIGVFARRHSGTPWGAPQSTTTGRFGANLESKPHISKGS